MGKEMLVLSISWHDYRYILLITNTLSQKTKVLPYCKLSDLQFLENPKVWRPVGSKSCEDAERVGVESITVTAGTFEAVHFRLTSGGSPGDAWIVEGMPFGMIKWTGSGGEAAELVAQGDDAVSQITETPMEMPGG